MSSKAGNKLFDTEVEFTFEFLSILWKCTAKYTIERVEQGLGSNDFRDEYVVDEVEILTPDGYEVTNEINGIYIQSEQTENKVSAIALFWAEAENQSPGI